MMSNPKQHSAMMLITGTEDVEPNVLAGGFLKTCFRFWDMNL